MPASITLDLSQCVNKSVIRNCAEPCEEGALATWLEPSDLAKRLREDELQYVLGADVAAGPVGKLVLDMPL